METINIFDRNFMPYSDSSTLHKAPRSFNYVKNVKNFDGITIFTDHCYSQVKTAKSRYNIAWQVESPVHSNKHFYPMVKQYSDMFDMIWTYDETLIAANPDKYKRCNFGGTTVTTPSMCDDNRTNHICIVHSGKKDTPNHHLRQRIITELSDTYNIDVYGRVTGTPFTNIQDVYCNYKFAIIIENINHDNYFSEKLTDAMACGCVPIYNGSTIGLNKFFDSDGVICWKTMDDLLHILKKFATSNNLFDDKYSMRYNNYRTVCDYFYTNEDWLFDNYINNYITTNITNNINR